MVLVVITIAAMFVVASGLLVWACVVTAARADRRADMWRQRHDDLLSDARHAELAELESLWRH